MQSDAAPEAHVVSRVDSTASGSTGIPLWRSKLFCKRICQICSYFLFCMLFQCLKIGVVAEEEASCSGWNLLYWCGCGDDSKKGISFSIQITKTILLFWNMFWWNVLFVNNSEQEILAESEGLLTPMIDESYYTDSTNSKFSIFWRYDLI